MFGAVRGPLTRRGGGQLLDEEVYLCSERTMYRSASRGAGSGTPGAAHPSRVQEARVDATAPNQVWSWDITRLLGPKKWSYY